MADRRSAESVPENPGRREFLGSVTGMAALGVAVIAARSTGVHAGEILAARDIQRDISGNRPDEQKDTMVSRLETKKDESSAAAMSCALTTGAALAISHLDRHLRRDPYYGQTQPARKR